MMLIFGNEDTGQHRQADLAALISEVDGFNAAMRGSGNDHVTGCSASALCPIVDSPRSSRRQYLEAKEYVGYYFVVDGAATSGRWRRRPIRGLRGG